MTKKIMIVTTGRADYGLLYPLIKKFIKHPSFELQLIATGSHLSLRHGNTISVIEEDPQINLTGTVFMTMEGDSENIICESIATGLHAFSKKIGQLRPDLILILGDRYELWAISIAAVIHKIPIAHIHGGESTFGLIDDPIRHSITKMSTFHFAAIDTYAKRIIQMGEHPRRVFVVGALGIDNILSIPLLDKNQLSEITGMDFNKSIALMTYHPVTLDDYNEAENQIREILNTLCNTELRVLMTMPNTDTSGDIIYKHIQKFTQYYPDQFKLIKSLGQKNYLSAIKYAKLMIGNSSSGIIESTPFKIPVINIGDRQKGRHKTPNIIDCECNRASINSAIKKALSQEFKNSIQKIVSPYGDGKTADRIIKILESIDFTSKSALLKKGFFDLPSKIPLINKMGKES